MAYDPADERVKANLGSRKKRKHMGSCGCDKEDGEYAALTEAFAAAEAEADLSPDPRGTTVRRWKGLVAPYGVPTGDGRRFAAEALSSRDLPLPVKWQRTDSSGHSTAVTVGRIDGIDYTPDGVEAWGIIFDPDREKLPRLAEDANEAYELLQQKVIGPSVDLDDMEFHPLGEPAEYAAEGKQEIEVTKGRISAITLVQIPAFAEARPFALDDLDADQYAEMTAVTAAGVAQGMDQLPVADVEWDAVSLFAPGEFGLGDGAGALYSRGDEHLFPVAQLVDGELRLVPGAVADAVSVLAYHGDDLDVPPGAQQAMREELEALTAACGQPAPPWVMARRALVASGGRGSVAAPPPAALFADPKLPGPTPIRIERVGDHLRYVGHVATWGVCHIGFPGQCVTAPRSRNGYAYFHVGSTDTADKGRIKTGKVTLGGGHADTSMGFQAALSHYDESGTAVVDARAGEDAYGIWMSGVVRPGVDERRLSELASAPLSGDWRHVGGGLELVAALAVNTPGFPVVQVHRRGADDLALVAAGVLVPEQPAAPEEASVQTIVRAEFARYRRASRAANSFAQQEALYARERAAAAAGVFG